MTDRPPSPESASPDDELVSAVLDGEASAAERARVESDPALAARLEQMRATQEAIAAPVTFDEIAARRMLDTVLDAAALPGAAGARPARRRRSWGDPGRWAAAAAVVLLALLAVPVLASLGSDGGDDGDQAAMDTGSDESGSDATSTGGAESGLFSADEGGAGAADAAEDSADGATEEGFAAGTAEAPVFEELGDHPDVESLAADARARASGVDSHAAPVEEGDADPSAAGDPGPSVAESGERSALLDCPVDPGLGVLVWSGTGTVSEESLGVRVWRDEEDLVVVEVIDPSSCATLHTVAG